MTYARVVFEAGTIADAMKRAGSIAPTKAGAAFDAAAGIVMDINPGSEVPCIIRATDLDVYLLETLDVVSAEGDRARWRLPSALLANVIGTQAPKSGKNIIFEQISETQISVRSGSMKSHILLNWNPSYPDWEPSRDVKFTMAQGLGAAIQRVIWAADRAGGLPVLSGFHLDGEYAIATDRFKVARVPLELELEEPITIPAARVGALTKAAGDVMIGVEGNLFIMMPDDYTEIKTTILGGDYIAIEKVFNLTYSDKIVVSKNMLTDTIQKAVHFAGSDRSPAVDLYIGRGKLSVVMQNPEVGQYGDVIDLPGQAEHERIKLTFAPSMIIDALNHAPIDAIAFSYNVNSTGGPIKIDGGMSYECWVAPRKAIPGSSAE